MPKPKGGLALFDLLDEDPAATSADLKVPPWWARGAPPGDARSNGPAARGRHGSDQAIAPDEAVARAAREPDEPAPLVELDGEYIRISLTTAKTAIVIGVAAACLLAAFEVGTRSGRTRGLIEGYELGRASYAAGAVSEIDAARLGPPATDLVGDLLIDPEVASGSLESVTEEDSLALDTTPWVQGNTYVVVQEFSGDRLEDGRLARAFLAEHGVNTVLVELPSGALQLLTVQGYNRQAAIQRAMADELLGKIHSLGEQYYASGGRYRLKGYFKKITDDIKIVAGS